MKSVMETRSSEWAGSRGHLCDMQGEVQVSLSAGIWFVFSREPTRPRCAQASGPTPRAWPSVGPTWLWDNESRIYSS